MHAYWLKTDHCRFGSGPPFSLLQASFEGKKPFLRNSFFLLNTPLDSVLMNRAMASLAVQDLRNAPARRSGFCTEVGTLSSENCNFARIFSSLCLHVGWGVFKFLWCKGALATTPTKIAITMENHFGLFRSFCFSETFYTVSFWQILKSTRCSSRITTRQIFWEEAGAGLCAFRLCKLVSNLKWAITRFGASCSWSFRSLVWKPLLPLSQNQIQRFSLNLPCCRVKTKPTASCDGSCWRLCQ